LTNQTNDKPKYGDRKYGKKTWYGSMGIYVLENNGMTIRNKIMKE